MELCDPCAAGYYQDEPGQSSCNKCNAGSYCPQGSSIELMANCEQGTYANSTDADGHPQCFDFSWGSFSPAP